MKKSAFKFLTCLAFLVFVIGCEPEEDIQLNEQLEIENDISANSNDILVNPNVKVIDDEKYKIISVSENEVVFEKSSVTEEVKIGDIIVSGITKKAQDGFMRKITQIEQSASTTKFYTVQADFGEVFEAGTIDSKDLDIQFDTTNTDAKVQEKSNGFFRFKITKQAGINFAEFYALIKPNFHFYYNKENGAFRPQRLQCAMKLEIRDLEVKARFGAVANLEIGRWSLPNLSFVIAGVPVVFTNKIILTAKGRIYNQSSFQGGLSINSGNIVAGLDYQRDNGGWRFYGNSNLDWKFTLPSLNMGTLNTRLDFPIVTLQTSMYNVDNFNFFGSFSPITQTRYNPSTRDIRVQTTGRATVGVKAKFFNLSEEVSYYYDFFNKIAYEGPISFLISN